MDCKAGYQNYDLGVGAQVGGLLDHVYDWVSQSVQNLPSPTGTAAILFTNPGLQNLPAPAGNELTLPLPTDTDFIPQTAGLYLVKWSVMVETFNTAATNLGQLRLWLEDTVAGEVPGTNRRANIYSGGQFLYIDGFALLDEPGGGANTYQLMAEVTDQPGIGVDFRVRANYGRIQWQRIT